MYSNFFGFDTKPFELTPDPDFLYLSHELKEVFATLKYGIMQRRGFILLVGEPGTGKTTLLNALADQSEIAADFAYLFDPDMDFKELLHTILIEFGLASVDESLSKTKAMHRLKSFVHAQYEKDRNALVLVDEAQSLDMKTLEKLRLLSNLETRQHKLIQIILAGQPELENTLSHRGLVQLAQRIGLRCRTSPLGEKDAYDYIKHRLKVAGYNGPQLFGNKAKHLIWTQSKGIPRLINIICDHSLLTGYSTDQKRIDSSIVQEVIDDLNKVPLDKYDTPSDTSEDMHDEVSQIPLAESDETGEVTPELPEKDDEGNSDLIDKLRKKLFGNLQKEPYEGKLRRFSPTWIAVIAGIVIIINLLILFLFIGSFKEYKKEVSSKLESKQNNLQSEVAGTENSKSEAPPDNKLAVNKILPASSSDAKEDKEKNTVVVKKGESLSKIMIRVFGKDDPRILDAILKINPEIKDPNFISENQVIKLPDKVDFD